MPSDYRYTIKDVEIWVATHQSVVDNILQSLLPFMEEIRMEILAFAKSLYPMESLCLETSSTEDSLAADCWLADILTSLGATDKEIFSIRFVHGQRSYFSDPYVWAVAYANEYAETGKVSDQPTHEFIRKVFKELFDPYSVSFSEIKH